MKKKTSIMHTMLLYNSGRESCKLFIAISEFYDFYDFILETGSSVVQADLKLHAKLALNFQSSFLQPMSAGIIE